MTRTWRNNLTVVNDATLQKKRDKKMLFHFSIEFIIRLQLALPQNLFFTSN